jgi:beta-phosphoglucomutase
MYPSGGSGDGLPTYDAILFDFDGVLADTEPLHWECWREVLLPLGVDLKWDTYHDYFIGLSDQDLLEIACRDAQPPVPVERALAERPAKQRLFRKRVKDGRAILPRSRKILTTLSKSCKLAVVTSSDKSEIGPALEAAGVLSCLTAFVAANDVERMKPDPEPYLLAARLLGAQTPLVVEDSQSGLLSARAAGFDALEVRNAASMPEQLLRFLKEASRRA